MNAELRSDFPHAKFDQDPRLRLLKTVRGLKFSKRSSKNSIMENEKHRLIVSPLYSEAKALSLSVATIRKARGKKNPRDFTVDTPEWHRACCEFAADVWTALEVAPDTVPGHSMG